MTFSLYEASAPVFVRVLTGMGTWLDKALAEGKDEATIMASRLAPDMRPFPSQIQLASDSAKGAMARLAGVAAPSMADTESSFAELGDRLRRTADFISGVAPSAFEGADGREVTLRFPNGMGYRFTGRDYLTSFALPNFLFHATTTYSLLRAAGVGLGKLDFLRLGPPVQLDRA